MSKSSGRGAIASASFTRRRILAALGALGVSPGVLPLMARSAEAAEEKWVCKVAEPTIVGVHELRYHVEDQSVTTITAIMRFDLDGMAWTSADLVVHGADPRDLSSHVPESSYGTELAADVARRRAFLERLSAGPRRDLVTQMIGNIESDAAWLATSGWMDINLRNPPGRADTLALESIEVCFPPLGVEAGLQTPSITIDILSGQGRIGSWTYEVTELDVKADGVGPAPSFEITDPQQLEALMQLLVADAPLFFKASETGAPDRILYQLELMSGYSWKNEYAVVGSLVPDVRKLAQASSRGQLDAYRQAHGKQGGDCETGACFLTTATVDAIGLADDCWELSTLRRFRDTWLARQSYGQALIADYYALAPGIVKRIGTRPDAQQIWHRTYLWGIVPAALAAHFGFNRLAVRLYRGMTRRLQRFSEASHSASGHVTEIEHT